MKTATLRPLVRTLGGLMVMTLAACGGGDGGDPVPQNPTPPGNSTTAPVAVPTPTTPGAVSTPTPAPSADVVLKGNVLVDQTIRNAVVCLDLNSNNSCDSNEPTSAATGADGAYSVSYKTSAVSSAQASSSSLIAVMTPGSATDSMTTVDAADTSVASTTRAYVLKQVPGKAAQINPLTTLVATGVAAGMSEAAARSNTALQLGIAETKIDNYQDDPAYSSAQISGSARTMAKIAAEALRAGVPLRVGDQFAALGAQAGDLSSLTLNTLTNYSFRTFDRLEKPAGVAGSILRDTRSGTAFGAPLTREDLYKQAYLSPAGWIRCDAAALFTGTNGTPSRSVFCGTSESAGYTVNTEIAGQTMASVIATLRAESATNTIFGTASTETLASVLGAAVFPQGARIGERRSLTLNQAIQISNVDTDIRPEFESDLEAMIARRSVTSLFLSGVGNTLTLGLGSGNLRNLRVGFTGTTSPTAGTVQYFECGLNAQQTVASNCEATQTGTYAISVVNGARVMSFAGHAETVMNHTRGFAEVDNAPGIVSGKRVYQVRLNKPSVASNTFVSKRLNATAWAALKAQLGL